MKSRVLGKTGIEVSEIGAGTWPMGGNAYNINRGIGWDNIDFEDCFDGLQHAIEHGVNIIDTANVYGLGKSERIISKLWTNKIIDRNKVIITSKLGYYIGCSSHGYDILNMNQQLEMSLYNLSTNYIDIYFLHHLDFGKDDVYLESAVREIHKFKEKGKIRFIGLRGPHHFSGTSTEKKRNHFNSSFERFKFLLTLIEPDVISVRYNMISEDVKQKETGSIFQLASQLNLGLLSYKTLDQGLLLNKYTNGITPLFSSLDHRYKNKRFEKTSIVELNKKLLLLKNKFHLKSTPDWVGLNISYVLSRPEISSALVGFRSKLQMDDILKNRMKLSSENLAFIDNVFKEHRPSHQSDHPQN